MKNLTFLGGPASGTESQLNPDGIYELTSDEVIHEQELQQAAQLQKGQYIPGERTRDGGKWKYYLRLPMSTKTIAEFMKQITFYDNNR